MRWVALTFLRDRYQAWFLREALEGNGVRCIVINEAANQWIGSLIQVRVIEPDLATAIKIYEELKAKTDKITCPECESDNVEFRIRRQLRAIHGVVLLALAFAAPIVTPLEVIFAYSCKNCGTEFRKEKF
jgi:hypothetical protein